MPRYDHLRLTRLPERLERRKPPGFGSIPNRNPREHTEILRHQLDEVVRLQRQPRPPQFVNPSLIVKVQMNGQMLEEDWERLGLTVLSTDTNKTLVLFSSSDDLRDFRSRMDAYAGEIPDGQANPSYAAFVGSIESIGEVGANDRIGFRLLESGISSAQNIADDAELLVDIEFWDFGQRNLRVEKLREVSAFVEANSGVKVDEYIGPSITMLRVSGTGALIKQLLVLKEVATIDLPPTPDLDSAEVLELTIANLPPLTEVDRDAPIIGIIDSGINSHPLIDDVLVGAIGVPPSLGTADGNGHGTRVAGVALLGDLRQQLAAGQLQRGARLCSARVVNDDGKFDDRTLVPSQMRMAISELHERFGCRVFVIALGDSSRPYDGGKVGSWAATLDELARELNVVIFVSIGNGKPPGGDAIEEAVTRYPAYLTEPSNRLLEPSGAINVVTVGSLAHGNGLDAERAEHLHIRPITEKMEPSPFTRIGPGVGRSIKPELVELGGTVIFDPVTRSLREGRNVASAGVLTTNHQSLRQLFTAGSGTSYAAPMAAFKASQLLKAIPQASANLIRALLVCAADIPEESRRKLNGMNDESIRSICGHGTINLERAAYSDDSRVVLFAEDELLVDHFAIYEVPIPPAFQGAGTRTIKVTLAFDPPVRHTRVDYAGIGMSFRLLRGCTPDTISEHFRRRTKEEGRFPEIDARFKCSLEPGPQLREKATVQTAKQSFRMGTEQYGDVYYLVVRCEGGWATHIARQAFSIVVELEHRGQAILYEQIRVRIRV